MIAHFFYVPFTGLGSYGGYRGDDWLRDRIKIFKTFVLPSLINQTKKEFIIWLSFRPEEKDNPIVKEFRDSLNGIRGLSTIFTFHGLCFYDDKYDEAVANARLLTNLQRTLPELKPFVCNSKWVYLTIQPSDDIYSIDATAIIQEQSPEKDKAIGWLNGYIMNYATKEIAEYNPDTQPPFTTIIFPTEIFLDHEKHFRYIGPYKSHEYVRTHLNFTALPGRKFCVGTHGQNISTVWVHPYKGREILDPDRERLWLDFGVWDADPVVIHRRFRLWGRIILNCLPRSVQEIVKIWYHKLRNFYYVHFR